MKFTDTLDAISNYMGHEESTWTFASTCTLCEYIILRILQTKRCVDGSLDFSDGKDEAETRPRAEGHKLMQFRDTNVICQ